jgi:predicted NAD/FAD-binding protein
MNELQDLDTEKEIFVTLGKFKAIEDELVIRNLSYEHISYSFNTLKGQEKINKLQGFNNTY